jgi:hypothetical protein
MSDGIKYYNVKRGKLYTLFGVYLNVKAWKKETRAVSF